MPSSATVTSQKFHLDLTLGFASLCLGDTTGIKILFGATCAHLKETCSISSYVCYERGERIKDAAMHRSRSLQFYIHFRYPFLWIWFVVAVLKNTNTKISSCMSESESESSTELDS
jgi:hypothetical protein